jgi:hypothetical protein
MQKGWKIQTSVVILEHTRLNASCCISIRSCRRVQSDQLIWENRCEKMAVGMTVYSVLTVRADPRKITVEEGELVGLESKRSGRAMRIGI